MSCINKETVFVPGPWSCKPVICSVVIPRIVCEIAHSPTIRPYRLFHF